MSCCPPLPARPRSLTNHCSQSSAIFLPGASEELVQLRSAEAHVDSLISDAGVPVEHIARLVGHSGTTTTETVYRKQIRPVLIEGADAMDRIFRTGDPDA